MLFELLEANRFQYAVRREADGTPYAGFRWRSREGSPELQLTAQERGTVLRITAHDLRIDEARVRVFDATAGSPLARAYRHPETGAWEVVMAIDVAGARPASDDWVLLLAHLEGSVGALAGNRPLDEGLPELPPLHPEAELEDVAEVLRAFGLSPSREGGRSRVTLELPRLPVSGEFLLGQAGVGWLRVEGRLTTPLSWRDAGRRALWHRLQWWAPVGRFAEDEDGRVAVVVSTPFLGRTARAVTELALKGAMSLLGTAHKHLGAPGGSSPGR
jgi:hypothetical protein